MKLKGKSKAGKRENQEKKCNETDIEPSVKLRRKRRRRRELCSGKDDDQRRNDIRITKGEGNKEGNEQEDLEGQYAHTHTHTHTFV